jgi:hypothetical protein
MAFVEIKNNELENLSGLSKRGFVFNWQKKSSPMARTAAVIFDGLIEGLVEYERRAADKLNYMYLIEVSDASKGTGIAGMLLAYVGKDSIEQGFDGFVLFESKTVLYEYYQDKYGAKPIDGRRLYFDTEATQKLIHTYLEVDDDSV